MDTHVVPHEHSVTCNSIPSCPAIRYWSNSFKTSTRIATFSRISLLWINNTIDVDVLTVVHRNHHRWCHHNRNAANLNPLFYFTNSNSQCQSNGGYFLCQQRYQTTSDTFSPNSPHSLTATTTLASCSALTAKSRFVLCATWFTLCPIRQISVWMR